MIHQNLDMSIGSSELICSCSGCNMQGSALRFKPIDYSVILYMVIAHTLSL